MGLVRPLLLSLVVVALSACESENAVACQQYLSSYNQLPCAAGTDSGIECEAFADHPCDVAPYFPCLTQNQRCDEDGALVSDTAACAPLLNCGAN